MVPAQPPRRRPGQSHQSHPDDDHRVADEELVPLAVGGGEAAFGATQALRPVHRDALARHQRGKGIDPVFDDRMAAWVGDLIATGG